MKTIAFVFAASTLVFAATILHGGELLLKAPEEISVPFATDTTSHRSYRDFKITDPEPLGRVESILLEFRCDRPEAIGSITLYFQSEKGWYGHSGVKYVPVAGKRNHFRGILYPKRFRTEGKPGPWNRIDTVRIAAYRGADVDTSMTVTRLELVPFSTLTVLPDDAKERPASQSLLSRMNRIGIESGSVRESELSPDRLRGRAVVCLANLGKLSGENTALIRSFVEKGGKLIAFYQLSPELMNLLGFDKPVYFKPAAGNESLLSEVRLGAGSRFSPYFAAASSFKQNSWNILVSKPLPGSQSLHATVAAWWHDETGRKTEYPALLLSDRGAFFSHILTDDDVAGKNGFLEALFTIYDKPLMQKRLVAAWSALFSVGDARKLTESRKAELKKGFFAELKKRVPTLEASFIDDLESDRSLKDFDGVGLLLNALQELRREEVLRYVKTLPSRTPEFRAWWEHAGTGAYPGDWDRTMKELSESGFNAILSNMLWGGSAAYKSDFLPTDPRHKDLGDQVAQAVEAGKKYGVDVHVWKVNFRLARAPKEFVEKMRDAGRLQRSRRGEEETWLCPSHPENIELEWKTMCELVQKYDVAGIHFDYIRYSNSDFCFCDGCRERFSRQARVRIGQWPDDVTQPGPAREKWLKWRCGNISRIVEITHREAKKIRPDILISAAVFRDYPDVLTGVGQDWKLWTEKGWLDFLCPMDYTESLDKFENWLIKQTALSKIPVYPGIGAASSGTSLTPDQVAAQIELARAYRCQGYVIFNLNGRTADMFLKVLHSGPTREKVPPPKWGTP